MIDHLSVAVADTERARRFYDTVLAPLGGRRLMVIEVRPISSPPAMACAKASPRSGSEPASRPAGASAPPDGQHIAFAAPDRAAVDAFYRVALAAGGRHNGAPGIRADYHANYYDAFVIDPDGNHIEAVCHQPA